MDSKDIELAQRVGLLLLNQGQLLALAESCTGGGIAALITEISGSAQWFERGFVTYSNLSKEQVLGVPAATLSQYGAVSEEVVKAMAEGALLHSVAHWAVAVSGVAGPTGGSSQKPVGTVCVAWAHQGGPCEVQTYHFDGDRQQVRAQTTRYALQGLITRLDH
ncbi:MAG: damage-inducible protein CinA [Ferrovum sp. 37-45-19]|uniref:CinA family protein n=1 Tax=Ferrovum sp. JA12 TaxID=1356299 RepID=UPI0007035ABD|nr:CinA family protein [Ferrovum sp. JA12]OYV79846.1 MAG: damage-inducible protein CinA [Ferrovum sp. 21-44-67]OYV95470.1 MAG: damage-inducible protein CinA [Ferrovum sp. 37-45-19]OZB31516.1 MAG: damage-inducible protein CinA [Ferrovum sp. 34-44-207]HQT81266.1 CinA family protein [Ferrovaceae bacterium]KRH78153.1 nicotinamide-nucleotide amidohydrolase PncC [Ferrovum sp. JA12]